MNDTKFKDKVKQRFEQDVPDVLQQIKASPQFFVPKKQTIWSRFTRPNKSLSSLLAVFVVALIVVFSVRQLQDPVVASTVTLDINPSIVITLDEDDYVISVAGVNNDGEQVIQRNIRYRGLTIDEVVELLVDRLDELGYIVTTDTETNVILFEVDSSNDAIRARVEARFQERLDAKMEQYSAQHWVMNGRQIPVEEDRNQFSDGPVMNTYTRAKLTLVHRIHELDDSYTLTALLRLNIRQLYTLYIELENPENLPDYDEMPGHRPNDNNPGPGGNSVIPVTA